MSSYDKTPIKERVMIWIVAIMMVVFTVVGFASMIIASLLPKTDSNKIANEKMMEDYKKQMEDQQKKIEQMQEERQKSLKPLPGYENQVGKFDAKSVTSLKVDVLQEGTGATVSADDTISANYTGWTADGKIFDSTNSKDGLVAAKFSLQQVIKGWRDGLAGRRVGGTYLLTIPADMAYGKEGAPSIAPNSPLKFVVSIVDLTQKQK